MKIPQAVRLLKTFVWDGGGKIKWLISIYRESGIFDEDQIQLIGYATKSIVNDISKLIILLSVAVLTDTVELFLVVTIPFVSVRTFTGGIHMKTYRGCLCATAVLIFGGMILAFWGRAYTDMLMFFLLISLGGYMFIGPKVSSQKMKMTAKRKKNISLMSILLEIMYILIAIFCFQNPVYQAGIYIALLINNMQVLILHRKERENA